MTAPAGWDGLLDKGERILWQGRPDGAVKWAEFSATEALVGVFLMAIAVNTLFDLSDQMPLIGFLIVILFFSVGFYAAIGKLFMSAFRRSRTFYTLTNQRAFVAVDYGIKRTIKSYPIGRDDPIELVEGPGQTIYFAKEFILTRRGSKERRIGFQYIADARQVMSHIRTIQKGLA